MVHKVPSQPPPSLQWLDIVQLHGAGQWRHSACAPQVVGLDPQMCSLHLCTQTQHFISCFLCLPCILSGTKQSVFPVLGAPKTRMCPDKDKEVENGPRAQLNLVTDKPEIQHLCTSLHHEDKDSHSPRTVFCLSVLSHHLQVPETCDSSPP